MTSDTQDVEPSNSNASNSRNRQKDASENEAPLTSGSGSVPVDLEDDVDVEEDDFEESDENSDLSEEEILAAQAYNQAYHRGERNPHHGGVGSGVSRLATANPNSAGTTQAQNPQNVGPGLYTNLTDLQEYEEEDDDDDVELLTSRRVLDDYENEDDDTSNSIQIIEGPDLSTSLQGVSGDGTALTELNTQMAYFRGGNRGRPVQHLEEDDEEDDDEEGQDYEGEEDVDEENETRAERGNYANLRHVNVNQPVELSSDPEISEGDSDDASGDEDPLSQEEAPKSRKRRYKGEDESSSSKRVAE